MSAYSEKPLHEEKKNRSMDEARTFKKTNTVDARPGVTDHDINDEYIPDPPRNVPDAAPPDFITTSSSSGMKTTPKEEKLSRDPLLGGGGASDPPLGLYEEEGTGRAKPLDVQTDLIDTSESASRGYAWV